MKKNSKLLNFYCIIILLLMFTSIFAFVIDSKTVYGAAQEPTENNWGLYNAKVFEAQRITKGSAEVNVGIIDGGISEHPMLRGAIDEDLSKSFVKGFSAFVDNTGHGTFIAGMIASQLNESLGMGGVAPNVKLVSLKISNTDHWNLDYVIDAINYATYTLKDDVNSNDIAILNYSGGGVLRSYSPYIVSLKEAIEDYCNEGGLLIVAAGNLAMDIDGTTYYPAAYDLDEEYLDWQNKDSMISVGAIKSNNQLPTVNDWGYDYANEPMGSNWGEKSVDLFAPGDNVYSTVKNGGYDKNSGTSFAAPFVTGVAALLKSINPALTGIQMKEIILDTVDEVNSLSGLCVTGGKLNALRAVNSIAYDYDAATSTITGLNFVPNGELTLPSTLRINNNDEEIENIGYNTFQNCAELTEITIPSGVKTIGDYSFSNCKGLTKVIFGSAVS